MKKVAFLLLAMVVFGCSNDDEKEDSNRSVTLTETIKMDTHPVYKTETYSLVNDQVTSLNVKQSYVESETTFGTQLVYQGNTVTRTDINGKQAIYTLNTDGYVTKCHYEEPDIQRDYAFSYSTDNYLERIDESINGQPHFTLTITYKEGDITSVNQNGSPIIYEPGTEENSYAFPCLPLWESYPMEYHKEVYFCGLLGKATRHFVTRTAHKENETEWTEYTYAFTPEGKPTNINTKLTYTGKIYDSEGIESTTTSTVFRHIAINM